MGAPTSPPPPPLPPPGRSAAPPPPPPPPGAPVSVAAKPWYRRWWAIALWVVLGLGFIANLTDRNTDEVPIEPSAEAQSARAADDEPAEVEASEEAFAAPAFRGRSYLDAEDRAKSVGLTLRAVDEAGNAVAIISRGNWEVEGQNPEPGDMVKAGDEVTVEVFRPRDREREEAERQAAEREREEVAERQALEEERLRHEQDESNYASLEAREFALLMKNPDDYSGDFYVLYGEVSQFDAATGNDTFRAHASHTHQDHFFLDGENVVVTGDAELLHEVVKGDVVKMYVVSLGSLSYKTQIGGATTVPHFRINLIEMLN